MRGILGGKKPALLIAISMLAISSAFASAGDGVQAPVRAWVEKEGNGTYIAFAQNSLPIPAYVSVNCVGIKNLSPSDPLPYEAIIPASTQKQELFQLVKMDSSKGADFQFDYRYAKGDPLNVCPGDIAYFFPFEYGSSRQVSQGYNGRFSHRGNLAYSLDFPMPEGTIVTAARDGYVVEVKQDSNAHGRSHYYDNMANYVRVYQADGTFATYMHLKQYGAFVKPGDYVNAGQPIALSGQTGRVTGPHLHFDVRVPTKFGVTQTIPVKFFGDGGETVNPVAGKSYVSYLPGREPALR
jgi:murein DD-endopeptidase MepM/ murein hydrolase activator NlpD